MPKRKGKSNHRQATTSEEEAITEYERLRQERIRENRERFEALGLPTLSTSLIRGEAPKGGGNGKKKPPSDADADEEYRPSDEGPSSHSERDDEDELKVSSSASRRRSSLKGKSKIVVNGEKARKKLVYEGDDKEVDINDEDNSLAQAIALSLGELVNTNVMESRRSPRSRRRVSTNDGYGERSCLVGADKVKKKKENTRRVHMTEDEAIAYFFTFDEAGKGTITCRDLKRVAVAHDFCWSDKEISDMICLFDSTGDGKLSLKDFDKIVSRCNLLQES